ncbi:MAG TPA: glutamine amidotransferase [Solirubrobacteraceae bacterium]|nr:glutamine amidotransferase [Solirubrobacteraceae bacterium]
MSEQQTLRVCALYPDLMNIYADRGNLLMLRRRCEWRGIGFELTGSGIGEELDRAADLYYMGGGQDRDQQLCAEDLFRYKRGTLVEAAANGAVVLGVCGGYQLLGHAYQLADQELPGIGLLDARTVRADGPRLIGNVVIEVDLPGAERGVLAGFENHAGRTHLGERAQALGRVLKGHGNNGSDALEGACEGTVIGTYMHGPLLPKNAWFADWLIGTALADGVALEPLHDELEQQAHADARRAAGL